jgi:hypothetical protein
VERHVVLAHELHQVHIVRVLPPVLQIAGANMSRIF